VIGAGGFSGSLTLVAVGASEQEERRRIRHSEAKTFIYFYCLMPPPKLSTWIGHNEVTMAWGDSRLQGKISIVTGASRGIGRAIAGAPGCGGFERGSRRPRPGAA
jgi:hypothetical protein